MPDRRDRGSESNGPPRERDARPEPHGSGRDDHEQEGRSDGSTERTGVGEPERTSETGGQPGEGSATRDAPGRGRPRAHMVGRSREADRADPPAPEPDRYAPRSTTRPDGWAGFAYDVVTSVIAVLLVGGFLFAVSGVWPPLVAVESGSMVPNMHQGDLVFVMEEHRFAGPGTVGETGVVTAARGARTDYRTFGGYGDVIVYAPDGNSNQTPIIHRAITWVEAGQRWYDDVDPGAIADHVNSCAELPNCPAPHAGFITKGDNNGEYDQANRLSGPVKPEWIVGTAEVRLPGLGWIRLGSQ